MVYKLLSTNLSHHHHPTYVSMTSQIDITCIQNLVSQKSFDEIKSVPEDNSLLYIRECQNEELCDLYLIASDTETQNKCKDENEFAMLLQANGIIFEKGTNNVVCAAQNKLIDVDIPTAKRMLEMHSNFPRRFEYCEDGTVIRLYFFNGKWRTATSRRIDASSSYWASTKSFEQMFNEVFPVEFYTKLDTAFTYTFILLHNENRIVVKHKYNTLVYISRIHNGSLQEEYTNVFQTDSEAVQTIRRPKQVNFKSRDDVNFDDFNSYFHPLKRGIVMKFLIDKTWVSYKIDFPVYTEVKQIRGNVPQIEMRYLDLLNDPETLTLLQKYYYENRFKFMETQKALNTLVHTLYTLYVDSHIKHNTQVGEDNKYFKTLKQLHAQYKTTNKPITYDDVRAKVYSFNRHVLKSLV